MAYTLFIPVFIQGTKSVGTLFSPCINTITRILCVCLSVCHGCDVIRNVYSGNEATTYTVTRTLVTSLLTVGTADIGQL